MQVLKFVMLPIFACSEHGIGVKNREKIKQEIMNNKAQQIQIEFITHLDRNCRYEVEDGKTEK